MNAIKILIDRKDLNGLAAVLRLTEFDPIERAEAATALGEFKNLNSVENLIRSYKEDPEVSVQEASYKALEEILGSRASMAINSYVSPQDDPWMLVAGKELNETELINGGFVQFDDNYSDIQAVDFNDKELNVLNMMLGMDISDEKREKIQRIINQRSDHFREQEISKIESLMKMAIGAEDEIFRQDARNELTLLFPENDIDALIMDFMSGNIVWNIGEPDDEGDIAIEQDSKYSMNSIEDIQNEEFQGSINDQVEVFQEETPNWHIWFFLALVILLILILAPRV
ncbi:MAG: hypothetical protein JEZ06_00145 [Anaerolineaceae bacterium]|nr:hypothetical protein [Anaerolineaceae bacterium]